MKPLTLISTPDRPALHQTGHLAGWINRRVSRKALAAFTRSLAVLVAARLPLLEALASAGRQSSNPRLRAAAEAARESVRRGQSLSAALARHAEVFDALYVQLVRVGEMTGRLGDLLLRLATYQEKAYALRRAVRLAMVYPGVIVAVATACVAFLLTVIVPTFAEMFADFGAELPAPTRALLALSNGLHEHAGVGLVVGLIFAAGARRLLRAPAGRRWADRVSLRIPLVGPLMRKSHAARFCRTLGTLLEGGVHLPEALGILARTSGHSQVEALVRRLATHVERGGRLAAPLHGDDVFPEFVVQMVAVGEETAHLDEMLLHAAGHFEEEVDAAVETLTSVIEPILIAVLGLVIGGTLVALYLPLFELTGVVR